MTADHPTREERYAAVREQMIRVAAEAMHTCTSHPDYPDYDEAPCCGTPTPAMGSGADVEWHHQMGHEKGARGICWACEPSAAAAVDALLAAALVAADPAPAQPDAALSEAERAMLHHAMAAWAKVMPYNHLGMEYGLSDGIWTRLDAAVERILAARAAQPEVSRGVAEVKAEALREAARALEHVSIPQAAVLGVGYAQAELIDRADRIVRDALPADDGADCCRERTTAGGCGCGGGS